MPPTSEHRRRYMRDYMKARRAAEREARLAAGETLRRGRPKKERLPPPQSFRQAEVKRAAYLSRQYFHANFEKVISFARFEQHCQSRWSGDYPITRQEMLRAIHGLTMNGWLEPPQYSRRGLPKMVVLSRRQR